MAIGIAEEQVLVPQHLETAVVTDEELRDEVVEINPGELSKARSRGILCYSIHIVYSIGYILV